MGVNGIRLFDTTTKRGCIMLVLSRKRNEAVVLEHKHYPRRTRITYVRPTLLIENLNLRTEELNPRNHYGYIFKIEQWKGTDAPELVSTWTTIKLIGDLMSVPEMNTMMRLQEWEEGSVRLAFDAPQNITILREELIRHEA